MFEIDSSPFRPWWARALGLTLLAFALSVIAWWPMIDNFPGTPELDGRYCFHQFALAKASIRIYGEYPLWNPYDCAGIPAWDHPETMTNSPVLLAATWLSTTVTIYVWCIVHCMVGFIGMWMLARHEISLSRTASFVAASMWAFGVCHTSQYAGAHLTFVCFWYFPLVLFLWRRAERNPSAAVGCGAVLALMLFEGATYPLPFTVLVLGLDLLTRLRRGRITRVLVGAAIAGFIALVLGAARLLPLVDAFGRHTRSWTGIETDHSARWYTLKQMYTWREMHWWQRLPGQFYVFGEYIAYIGYALVAIAAVGLVVMVVEEGATAFLAGLVFLFMLGHFALYSPWTLAQLHFPFRSMRVPSRFRIILHAFLALSVGLAVDRFPALFERWFGKSRSSSALKPLLLVVALLGIGDMMGLGMEVAGSRHEGPQERHVEESPRFYYGGHDLAQWIDQPRQGRAWTGCASYEWPNNSEAPIWTEDVPQVKAKDDAVRIVSSSRTHNTFTFEADAQRPGRVLLNSAYELSWRSNVGSVVEDFKLLAVDVPAGHHTVKLRYWPQYFTLGLWISGVAFASCLAFLVWQGRRRFPGFAR